MSLYAKYETDQHAEVEGVPYTVADGVTFYVARVCERNMAYQAERAKINKVFEKQLATGETPVAYQDAILRLFSKHIIKDWHGVTDRNGEHLPYTVDNCVQVLTDLPDLYNELVGVSLDADRFNLSVLKTTVKK